MLTVCLSAFCHHKVTMVMVENMVMVGEIITPIHQCLNKKKDQNFPFSSHLQTKVFKTTCHIDILCSNSKPSERIIKALVQWQNLEVPQTYTQYSIFNHLCRPFLKREWRNQAHPPGCEINQSSLMEAGTGGWFFTKAGIQDEAKPAW